MEIRELNVDEIIPYENNPRFNDEAVEAVANSIKEFGFKVPIIVDKDKVIIAGHTRLLASKRLGLERVPVIFADDLTEEQVKAFRLADNKVGEIATWDITKLNKELEELKDLGVQMDLFGFEMPDVNIVVEDDYDIDTALNEIKEPNTKPGEMFQLGAHRLLCGDSTNTDDVKKLMNGDIADLLFTDPPYNVNIENSQGMKIENDNMMEQEFREFLNKAFYNASQNLKEGGAFYVWYASREHIAFESELQNAGLPVREQLIWVKNSFTFGRQDFKWQHEPCLYGWKDGATHYFKEEYNHPTTIETPLDIEKMSKKEMQELLEFIYSEKFPKTIIHEHKPLKNDLYPTMKPLRMCAELIRLSTQKNECVLDLFGGSGSTLMACEQLGRKCLTMEYDPKYCDVIIDRWEKETGKKAIKL